MAKFGTRCTQRVKKAEVYLIPRLAQKKLCVSLHQVAVRKTLANGLTQCLPEQYLIPARIFLY